MRPLKRISGFVLPALIVLTMTSSSSILASDNAHSDLHKGASEVKADERAADERASRSRTTDIIDILGFGATTTTTSGSVPTNNPSTSTTLAPAPIATGDETSVASAATTSTRTPTHQPNQPAHSVQSPPPTSPVPANSNTSNVNSSLDDFLLRALNNERTARGLPPLTLDPTLSKMAQSWSAKMGERGSLGHSGSGIPDGFNAFGENVLKASSNTTAGAMHNLWLGSSGHRKQMLQPGYDRVGIGAVCVNGSVYATETFGHSSAAGEANLSSDVPDATPRAPVSGGGIACG